MLQNTLIDNSSETLSMVNALKEFFAIPNIKTVRIATGYWDIPGLSLIADDIKTFLKKDDARLFLLIGKDPYVYANQMKDAKYQDANYPQDFIQTDLNGLDIKDEYKTSIELLLEYCTDREDSKIQIRIFRTNENDETQFLHSKCYIFDGKESGFGIGLIGSSNFTKKGLEGNAELNYVETSAHSVLSTDIIPNNKTHVQWFNEKWNLSEPWNKTFIEQILKPAPIAEEVTKEIQKKQNSSFTPYELYIKLLQIKYGDVVDKNLEQQIESYLPQNIHKLEYQLDAVKRCIGIMREHGGFMLADVVGLGKTIVGVLIAKHFICAPEDDGRERKILIVTPPAIKTGWVKTIAMFDEASDEKIAPYIDFITTGSIGHLLEEDEGYDDDNCDSGDFEETLEEKNYGLILIDESHKFRNSNTQMYQLLDELIQKIAFEKGEYPYIGLLSATPQNNRPSDLRNQIYLFERNHTDSTLRKAEGGNIERFFAAIDKEYSLLISGNTDISIENRKERLKEISSKIRECILNDILERRTRTDVKRYYAEDMISQELVFPNISGPHNLEYIMDDELAELFYDTMNIIAHNNEDDQQEDNYLRYYRYRAIEFFVNIENEIKHRGRGNRGVSDVSNQLARIMQILLVKRLESSFTAFIKSLQNLRKYTENMIKMWKNDTIFICPQIDINKEFDTIAKSQRRGKSVSWDDCVNDIRKKINILTEKGKNERGQNSEYKREDFKIEYYSLLKEDYSLISSLCDRWAENSQDPKLDAFKEKLNPVLFNPKTNTSRKLVIFSEAIDTVEALERAVKAKNHRVLAITAANRDELEYKIEENFDANYEGEWKDDYDVLITTEVLAEGVNLHRANVILNYDTPWNSTRLMQRIGRVNRIGSKEPYIYVYNFWPSAQGDSQIRLVSKAFTKLQLFHVLFGEDSKIFSEEEDIMQYDIVKAVEGEESADQKYIYELKQYKAENPQRYQRIESSDGNGVWEIASAETGLAYFVVNSPRGGRLYIRIKQEGDEPVPENISIIDMLEEIRVDVNTTSVNLPENWSQLSEMAIKMYNSYFVRINKSRAGDKRTKALEFIVSLFRNPNISENSKEILIKVRRLTDKGSYDIIKKVLAIEGELNANEQSLFKLSQEEIDHILQNEIEKLVSHVESEQGKASIILGTLK